MSNLNNETNRSDVNLMINYPNWMDFIGNGWIISFTALISFPLQEIFSRNVIMEVISTSNNTEVNQERQMMKLMT